MNMEEMTEYVIKELGLTNFTDLKVEYVGGIKCGDRTMYWCSAKWKNDLGMKCSNVAPIFVPEPLDEEE